MSGKTAGLQAVMQWSENMCFILRQVSFQQHHSPELLTHTAFQLPTPTGQRQWGQTVRPCSTCKIKKTAASCLETYAKWLHLMVVLHLSHLPQLQKDSSFRLHPEILYSCIDNSCNCSTAPSPLSSHPVFPSSEKINSKSRHLHPILSEKFKEEKLERVELTKSQHTVDTYHLKADVQHGKFHCGNYEVLMQWDTRERKTDLDHGKC